MGKVVMNPVERKEYLLVVLKEPKDIPMSIYLYREQYNARKKYLQLVESYQGHGCQFEEHSFTEYGDNPLTTVAFSKDIKLSVKRIGVE